MMEVDFLVIPHTQMAAVRAEGVRSSEPVRGDNRPISVLIAWGSRGRAASTQRMPGTCLAATPALQLWPEYGQGPRGTRDRPRLCR